MEVWGLGMCQVFLGLGCASSAGSTPGLGDGFEARRLCWIAGPGGATSGIQVWGFRHVRQVTVGREMTTLGWAASAGGGHGFSPARCQVLR